MHAQRVTEVRALHGDGVVEVLCVLAVYGEDRLAAQVKALCVFFVADGLVADALGFVKHFLRENMRNAVLLYNGIGVTAAIGARKAEVLRERNERRFHVFADRNKLRVVLAVK